MTNPTIFDGETTRAMTDAEYAQWQTDNANRQARDEAQEQDDTAQTAKRQAVLVKLGLTADEVAALLS